MTDSPTDTLLPSPPYHGPLRYSTLHPRQGLRIEGNVTLPEDWARFKEATQYFAERGGLLVSAWRKTHTTKGGKRFRCGYVFIATRHMQADERLDAFTYIRHDLGIRIQEEM